LTLARAAHYDRAMPASNDVATRLAPLAQRSTARITTRGRRSGRAHTVTIWFLVDGTTIYLGTLDARRDWVRNAVKTPEVTLEIDGLRVRGTARVITDSAVEARVRALLAGKYWMAWIGSWFGMGPARTLRVDDVEVT
jgi:hypothetical protein